MPGILTNRIYRGWKRNESYWDSPGMNENLKVISDHLPALRVLGVDISPLPSMAAEGDTVLHIATGKYSVWSLKADASLSSWETYPASKGMLALFNGQIYGNTGWSWDLYGEKDEVVTNLGSLTIDNTTPQGGGFGSKLFPETVPNGYNIGAGRMSFSADVVFGSYFSLNPNGHMAVILRQDPALSGVAVRGNGIAIGNLVGSTEGTQVNPGAQIEAWANTVNPQQNRLIPGADSKEALQDGVFYKLLVESSVGQDGHKYARMAIYKQTARGYDCVVDTGDVLDTLVGSDFTKSGLAIGHVFGANVAGWSIQFTNMKVWWGPFGAKNTDTSYIEQSESQTSQANTAAANATSFKQMATGAGRVASTIKMSDLKLNSDFGSWNADGSVFTFSKAGAYEFNISGVIGGLANNANTGIVKVTGGAYANFGTFSQWVGAIDSVIPPGSNIGFSAAITSTMRVSNVTAGQAFSIEAFLNGVPSGTDVVFGWGLSGGAGQSGSNSAGSGVVITPY